MAPPITLTTPLPAEDLRFQAMNFTAGMNQLDEMRLDMLSPKADIQAEDLLGKPIEVAILQRDGETRWITGYVTRFSMGQNRGRHYGYQATVRPWLWFLTRTTDCRIFQEMSTPDIVTEVMNDSGIARTKFKLTRPYRKRVYCVQYRESDFNFVARLLEDEGIAWYFEHGPDGHDLVLTDAASAHDPMAGEDTLPYYSNTGQVPPDLDYLSLWNFSRSVEPGKTVLTSYDFERPRTSLLVQRTEARPHALAEGEVFDFQGEYTQKPDGQQQVDDRLDERQTGFERLQGQTNAHAMAVGFTFKQSRHPREDQNSQFLCVRTQIITQLEGSESGSEHGDYQCAFHAIPFSQQYRPARRTPKPFVQGPQTAQVVGPSGEEIFTDKYSRVMVQFHWDRLGREDEKSSCWVRVSSPWAGKSFGFIQVPRIGQEVVVDFLEGDPDQPIITGRVYNADQMPPWDLPANATQSGVLTRSSKGGAYGNANALRFEDKKGAEQLWLHAEKNQDIEVENDETHWVGHDRTKTIDHDETVHVKHDRTETVDNDETITVHHDRKERVDRDETISIGRDRSMKIERDKFEEVQRNKKIRVAADHTENVDGSMSIVVTKTLTEVVGINYLEAVGGAMELTVGGALTVGVGAVMVEAVGGNLMQTIGRAKSVTVGQQMTVEVGKTLNETIGENRIVEIKKDLKQTIEGSHQDTVKKEYTVKAKKIVFSADDEIGFKTGDASITLKKNGDIVIQGGKIQVKGSGDVIVKGSAVKAN